MFKTYKKLVAFALAGVMTASACTFSTSAAQSDAQPSSDERVTVNNLNLYLSKDDIVQVTLNIQCDSIAGAIIGNIFTEKEYLYINDDLAPYVNKDEPTLKDHLVADDIFNQGLCAASIVENGDALETRLYTSSVYDVYDCREETPFITATFKALSDCETTVTTQLSGICKTIIDENGVHDIQFAMDESSISTDITINGFEMGDVNNDGRITVADAIEVQKHIANITTLTGAQYTLANINYDSRLTVADAIEIQKIIAGIV